MSPTNLNDFTLYSGSTHIVNITVEVAELTSCSYYDTTLSPKDLSCKKKKRVLDVKVHYTHIYKVHLVDFLFCTIMLFLICFICWIYLVNLPLYEVRIVYNHLYLGICYTIIFFGPVRLDLLILKTIWLSNLFLLSCFGFNLSGFLNKLFISFYLYMIKRNILYFLNYMNLQKNNNVKRS